MAIEFADLPIFTHYPWNIYSNMVLFSVVMLVYVSLPISKIVDFPWFTHETWWIFHSNMATSKQLERQGLDSVIHQEKLATFPKADGAGFWG